jgi:hypothetical protein
MGCGTRPAPVADSALVTVTDADRSIAARVRAVHALTHDDDPAADRALRDLAWSSDAAVPIAIAAHRASAARSGPAYLREVARGLDRLSRRAVLDASLDASIQAIQDHAPDLSWRARLTAAAARSMSRGLDRSPTDNRPERRLIAATGLADRSADALRALIEPTSPAAAATTLADRSAAWTALHRVSGPGEAMLLAKGLTPATEPAATLRWAADRLDQLPHNRFTLAWAMQHVGDHTDLRTGRSAGVALRHLTTLAPRFDPPAGVARPVIPPRATAPRRHRGAALAALPSEHFDDARPRLADADRRLLAIVHATLRRPDVAAALFALADADHADRTTERGGLLLTADDASPRIVFREYPPMRVGDDHAYTPGPELIHDLHRRGLAHVHAHAQRHRHAAYAGPAAGDLAFVRRHAVVAIVLTFLDPDTLNADYVQPDPNDPNATPLVIDLGTIARPR